MAPRRLADCDRCPPRPSARHFRPALGGLLVVGLILAGLFLGAGRLLAAPTPDSAAVAAPAAVPTIQTVAQPAATPVSPAAPAPAAALEQLPASLEPALFRLPKGDPSGQVLAVLTLVSAPGWHAYAVGPAESGQSARASLTAGDIQAPALFPPGIPTPDPLEPEKTVLIYEGRTPIFVPLSDQAQSAPALGGEVRVFSCSETSCWPSTLAVSLPLGGKAAGDLPQAETQPWWPLFLALRNAALASPLTACPDPALPASLLRPQGSAPAPAPAALLSAQPAAPDLAPRSFTPALEVSGLLKAAMLAFAAGFILNFMPCVLPVVSLKLSGLLAISGEEGKQERRRILREHNFFFALGIVVYFLLLSLILGAFGMAWGEMFQSPGLAIVVAVVLFALSLSLFGVFHLPVVDLKISSGTRGHTRRGAFLTGALTTLLATPCSGPFLGGVLAWTLLQPQHVIMTVFAAIGLGMAAPYAVLAIWPRLVRLLPRPGAWMQGLERAMAFVLAATCLYFLALLPPGRILPTLAAFWAVAFGATLLGRMHLAQSAFRGALMGVAALAVAGSGLALALTYTPPVEAEWVTYTPETFAERLGRDNLVLDFTADWCPTCKLLERTVLTPPRVAQWAARHKAVFMKVDLTRQTPPAMALLRALGSQSIPVAAFFPAGQRATAPLVLRDLFTAGQFEQAMDEAFGSSVEIPAVHLAK
ncbi:Cytochrome c-type biogenesis protein DsbD, protein-disulfide reductase [Desulfovibrio sp. DV]|uniref:protein-disulfide reductase DsbD family protein n=1 Tax=Desulfovibrio sp. DV TaxID=1844708 RepID=UPI00096752E5|nr:cytochrome c biogenesis protein CcdA [Desulfovibrio sp. DV]OLN29651.1 Cytochrome c-type biogenesis protein DsbD, protein-disulfide reductase [Desulfovibrio sp. DV]